MKSKSQRSSSYYVVCNESTNTISHIYIFRKTMNYRKKYLVLTNLFAFAMNYLSLQGNGKRVIFDLESKYYLNSILCWNRCCSTILEYSCILPSLAGLFIKYQTFLKILSIFFVFSHFSICNHQLRQHMILYAFTKDDFLDIILAF